MDHDKSVGLMEPEVFSAILDHYRKLVDGLPDDHTFRLLARHLQLPSLKLWMNFAGGGEPLTNPHIFDYIDRAVDSGLFRTWLITNGTLLNSARIERLIGSKLEKLEVTCLGINREDYYCSTGKDKFQ